MLVAVDTGGTKTLIAAFNDDGSVNDSMKFPTPPNVADYIAMVVDTIHTMCGSQKLDAVCIALPGQIKDELLVFAPNLGWKNVDVRSLLQAELKTKIFIENDANLAGLGETRQLKHVPERSLYITVSTGIGTGFTVDGKLKSSYSEGGHAMLEYNGTLMEWEQFASGRAIHKRYGKYARDITSKRAWRSIAKNIASGMLALLPFVRPDVVIIGGSIGTYFERYDEYLVGYLKEHLPARFIPKIVQAKHPEEAVIYGCYYYAVDRLTD